MVLRVYISRVLLASNYQTLGSREINWLRLVKHKKSKTKAGEQFDKAKQLCNRILTAQILYW